MKYQTEQDRAAPQPLLCLISFTHIKFGSICNNATKSISEGPILDIYGPQSGIPPKK